MLGFINNNVSSTSVIDLYLHKKKIIFQGLDEKRSIFIITSI